MATSLTLSLSGLDDLAKTLDKFEAKFAAATKDPVLLRTVGILLAEDFKENIRAGGRPVKFRPLKAQTLKRRKQGKGEGGSKILIDTGVGIASIREVLDGGTLSISMKRYMLVQNEGGDIAHPGGTPYILLQGGGAKPSPLRNSPLGTYAAFIKKDGSYPAGVRFTKAHTIPIPARRFAVVTAEALGDITEAFKDYLKKA